MMEGEGNSIAPPPSGVSVGAHQIRDPPDSLLQALDEANVEVGIAGRQPMRQAAVHNVGKKDVAHRPVISREVVTQLWFEDSLQQRLARHFTHERGGRVGLSLTIPAAQRTQGILSVRRLGWMSIPSRNQLRGQPHIVERVDIGLDAHHVRHVEALPWLLKQLEYAGCTVGRLPLMGYEKGVTIR